MSQQHDLAAGSSGSPNSDNPEDYSSPFEIVRNKDASYERLERWRRAALVLNSSRRLRYTLDLKKDEEEKEQLISNIRENAQTTHGEFVVESEQLASMAGNQTILDPIPQPLNSPPPSIIEDSPQLRSTTIADPESQQVISDNDQQNLLIKSVILAFCFTAALELYLHLTQQHSKPSISVSLFSLGILLTFSLLLLAKLARSDKVSKLLEKAAIVAGAATFYYMIRFAFPLRFKLVIWSISSIALLILVIYNRTFHSHTA